MLKLVNMRYAIGLNSFQKFIPTVLASDVSDETAAAIMENLDKLEGIDIEEESLRRYTDSKYFASIIGYTGKISQEEYDALDKDEKKKGRYIRQERYTGSCARSFYVARSSSPRM